MIGVLEGLSDPGFVGREVDQEVVGPVVVQPGSILGKGLVQIRNGGERVELGVRGHQSCGVLRYVPVGGDHGRVGRTDVSHPVHREGPLAYRLDVEDLVREGAHIGQVGAREHRVHTRQGEGRTLVDAHDPGVGLGTPNEGHFEHAGQLQIGDVALATQQGRPILPAGHGPADVSGPMPDHRVDARGIV